MAVQEYDGPPVASSKYVTGFGTCSGRNGCGAEWIGERLEHCTICHRTFAGSSVGEAHRVGPHDPKEGRRRCLADEELTALGLWQDDRTVWHGKANKAGVRHRRPTPAAGQEQANG